MRFLHRYLDILPNGPGIIICIVINIGLIWSQVFQRSHILVLRQLEWWVEEVGSSLGLCLELLVQVVIRGRPDGQLSWTGGDGWYRNVSQLWQ